MVMVMIYEDMEKIFEILLIPAYSSHFRHLERSILKLKINLWFTIFKYYDPKDVAFSIADFIDKDEKGFPPTPGKIKSTIRNLKFESQTYDAWEKLLAAISNSLYNSVENFESLDYATKEFLKSPNNLKKLSLEKEEYVNSVVREKFFEYYPKMLQRSDKKVLSVKGEIKEIGD